MPMLEFRLLCLAASPQPNGQELSRTVAGVTDWRAIGEAARRHRLAQRLYPILAKYGEGMVPPEILAEMHIRVLREVAVCHSQLPEIMRVTRGLAGGGVAVLVLKGVPLSQQLYGEPTMRGVGDIDLLVEPSQLRQADGILREAGYLRQGANVLDRNQTICQQRLKDIAYRHFDTGQYVELHQRLTENPYLLPCDFAALWRDRDTVAVADGSLATLPRRFLPLYLCIHGATHCWERLRWLADLAELLQEPGAVKLALADADMAGLGAPMRQALALCHNWLGLNVEASDLPAAATLDRFVHRFFSGRRWECLPKPGSREWLRRYSFWGRVHNWSLRSDWRYRIRELSSILIWPPDWETIPLPDTLFWLYPFLRPVGWVLRRGRKETP
ncbi:hypothetical protein H261_03758 [Paramagnetospirillum caucaseum]|uniref:Nucleotidyltransferase family protein n=1 Tax=Paramagnetospirillum caucaseum TaxID=1244869 RepID=M2ZA59_9PROT|nr:nucleotidyltransferase family protein [Paramagnetospirillum caucaseum]EME71280.1 hypothetical protein H261_03758 [Paramagnetospirillum caucaseum]